MKTRDLAYMGILAALCIVIEYVEKMSGIRMPQGGSLSLSTIPIILSGFILGPKKGLMLGVIVGVLQGILGLAYILSIPQFFLDYIVSLSVLGLAALFPKYSGLIIVNILRYFVHVLSGVIFFYEYAGSQNVWIYSFSYNATYMIPSMIATGIITFIIIQRMKLLKK